MAYRLLSQTAPLTLGDDTRCGVIEGHLGSVGPHCVGTEACTRSLSSGRGVGGVMYISIKHLHMIRIPKGLIINHGEGGYIVPPPPHPFETR